MNHIDHRLKKCAILVKFEGVISEENSGTSVGGKEWKLIEM